MHDAGEVLPKKRVTESLSRASACSRQALCRSRQRDGGVTSVTTDGRHIGLSLSESV